MKDYSRRQVLAIFSTAVIHRPWLIQTLPDAKQRVGSFLNDWLVGKRISVALNYFHLKAFTSKIMLADDCISPIAKADHGNPRKVRQGVEIFLREVTRWKKGESLKETLNSTRLKAEEIETTQAEIVGTMQRDGYLLMRSATLNTFDSTADAEYLKNLFPASAYLGLMMLVRLKKSKESPQEGELPVYICWALENAKWKIIHLQTQCI